MTDTARRKTTEVAVGVLLQPDGAVLLADRPAGKPYAGYWEFPGGKIEPGESVHDALARELHEELGVDIGPSTPWVTFEFDYPHAYVRLQFRRVQRWRGTPHAREGQRLAFLDVTGPLPEPLLPAAIPALKWLQLPPIYALTAAAADASPGAFLARADQALARGLRLIQLREPALSPQVLRPLAADLVARAHAHGARLLVSSRHPDIEADGVHLTSEHLMRVDVRPPAPWVGASVHDAQQLHHAARIGCDFVVLGPVLPTPSHPGAPALGWRGFERLALHAPLPVYAIGGLAPQDLERAQQSGAHGVALLSLAWGAR